MTIEADGPEQSAGTTPITAPITTPITTPISTQRQLASPILANPNISQQELAVTLHLNKMKRAGVIHHVGPARAGRWEVVK
jgi:hypothetical protein